MRTIACAALLAVCAQLGGCGLLIGGLIRDGSRKQQEQAQVVASLARYRQLIIAIDADRVADMFTPDGELSHDAQAPITGPGRIQAFLKGYADYKIQAYELRALATETNDGLASQQGTYSQTVALPSGAVAQVAGQFDANWARQADGRWLLKRLHTASAVAGATGTH